MTPYKVFSYIFFIISLHSNAYANNIEGDMNNAIQKLNDLYTSNPDACNIYANLITSPIDCSGVIIHGIEDGQVHAWVPDQTDARKAVSFSYLRSDIPTNLLFEGSGFVYDQTVRNNDATKLTFYCFYPFDAFSDLATEHPSNSHGCGLPDTVYASNNNGEFASCPDAQVANADDFINKYLENGTPKAIITDECSFSANNAQSFASVLNVQKKTASPYWNELITSTWNEEQAKKLPIIAFFYLIGDSKGHNQALEHQRDYCNSYQIFMPVVKLDLSKKNADAFTGDIGDQQPCP